MCAERLRARPALTPVGEGPALSSPDSRALYLTYGPHRSRREDPSDRPALESSVERRDADYSSRSAATGSRAAA
jgi:ethanolamine ammonia-lyase small subunit